MTQTDVHSCLVSVALALEPSLQAALSSDGVLEGVLLEDVEDSYTCEVEDFFSDAEDSLGIGGRRRCR